MTLDPWAAAQRLLGRWEGAATGQPGTGHQVRDYRAVLRGRSILGTDVTHWEPTADEPDGEVHEDLSMLWLDRGAGQLVMHSFHVEGFVTESRCVEASPDGRRLVFVAEHVVNGPPGWRSRETILLDGDDLLESTFELALPDRDFEPYTHERLRRVAEGATD